MGEPRALKSILNDGYVEPVTPLLTEPADPTRASEI
jgi:hypothetical protein